MNLNVRTVLSSEKIRTKEMSDFGQTKANSPMSVRFGTKEFFPMSGNGQRAYITECLSLRECPCSGQRRHSLAFVSGQQTQNTWAFVLGRCV